MKLQEILPRIKQVRKNGTSWMGLCPAHPDKNQSLSIREVDSKILLHCFAGCAVDAICAALGIEVSDLFNGAYGNSEWGQPWPDGTPLGTPSAVYDYGDEAGALLFQVGRFERIRNGGREKTFRQRRPDGNGGWIDNIKGVRRVLYRLADVLRAKSVLVCEGEKDCESARTRGIVATTNPGGAGKWRKEFSELLAGKRVAIIGDADEVGRSHASGVAGSLYGKVELLKRLELPGAKDLTEWLEKGGTREGLLKLISSAPDWIPEKAVEKALSRIVLVGADEFLSRPSCDDTSWLVDGLLPARSQTTWQGRPKVGKSHTLLQLAFDCACGMPVFGHFAVQRPLRVAYIELEEPEAITKTRFAMMLKANGNAGPDIGNLHFWTKEDLYRSKIPSRQLLGASLRDLAAAVRDRGVELAVLVALRCLVSGNLKDQEVAERLNDALDVLAQESTAALALAHHSRKEQADTLEAQGIGSTFVSAHADATFDIARDTDGFRKVGREGRYGEETFFLCRVPVNDGEFIRFSDPPENPRHPQREALLRRVATGQSVYGASKAEGVAYSTAKRWATDTA